MNWDKGCARMASEDQLLWLCGDVHHLGVGPDGEELVFYYCPKIFQSKTGIPL